LLVELGRPARELEATLGAARRDKRAADPQHDYLLARALVRGPRQQRDLGLKSLTNLWLEREENAALIPPNELGRNFALALMLRNRQKDARAAAKVILETLPLETDPLVVDFLHALANLAEHAERTKT
jgi:hypothetical protein